MIDGRWPGWRCLPAADGLVAFLPGHRVRTDWADVVLAHDADGFVVWVATGGRLAPSLALVTHRAGVCAAALAPAGADPGDVRAALRLACRLATVPAGQDEHVRVPVTCARIPDATHGLVWVAYPATVICESAPAADTVMWELLTTDVEAS